jgi:hypothetical protein
VFALTLLLMLLASINYQLNLGYALTFLLAGSGLVSMHLTHGTLRGLTLHLRPVAARCSPATGAARGRADTTPAPSATAWRCTSRTAPRTATASSGRRAGAGPGQRPAVARAARAACTNCRR